MNTMNPMMQDRVNQIPKAQLKPSTKRQLLSETEIISLLKLSGIPTRQLTIISTTPVKKGRYQTILKTKNPDSRKNIRTIIDVSFSAPTWQQYIDVTYNQGADCDYKVILYDELCADFVPSSDSLPIGNLVRINNRCSVPTFFISAEDTLSWPTRQISDFEIMDSPDDVDANPGQKLPSKREVEEAEFWVPYYWGVLCGSDYYEHNFEIDGCTSSYSAGRNLSSRVKWTQEGLFIELSPDTERREKGGKEIQWLWENKRGDIEAEYPGSSLTQGNTGIGSDFLSIRVDPTPFDECLSSPPEGKIDFAHFVNRQELDFVDLIEECLDEYLAVRKKQSLKR